MKCHDQMKLPLFERALSQRHHKIQMFINGAVCVRADEDGRLPLFNDRRASDSRLWVEAVSIKYRAIDKLVLFVEEYGALSLDRFRIGV